MNVVRTLVVARTFATAVIAAVSFAVPVISHAGPAEGVTCASDHPPQFANGVLKCQMSTAALRNSMCPPTLALNPIGDDTCRIPNSPPEVPAVSNSLAELVATDLVPCTPLICVTHDTPLRQPNAIARDRFSVTFHDWRYPDGAFFVGFPDRGVKCPSGSTAVRRNDGRNLRCEQQRENAICLGVYKLQVRNGKDICVIEVNGFIVNQQPTVPSGQLTSIGWTLDTDGPGGGSQRDQWVKFVDPVTVS